MNDRYNLVRSACTLGIFGLLTACGGGAVVPAGDPSVIPTQSLTFTPTTTSASPGRVLRTTSGLPASINATLVTHSVLVDNGSGLCVTEQASSGSAGFVAGQSTYPFTFVPIASAPANCTQTITVTLDGDVVTYFVIVP